MNYKRLGRSGLKVSAISLGEGSWGTGTADENRVREMMAQALRRREGRRGQHHAIAGQRIRG